MAGPRLDGRNALVTGAARGFGRETARVFAREGARVVLNYNASEARARELADEIAREVGPDRTLLVRADVGDPAQVEAMTRTALDRFGRLDILVNNAGVLHLGPFESQPLEDWLHMLHVNVNGVLNCTRAIAPPMLERGFGRIINLGTQLTLMGGMPGFAFYTATKGFVSALTKSLAKEWGQRGVTVNCVGPGSIVTDMNASFYPPEVQEQRRQHMVMGRFGEPVDVAYACLYLASDEAKFMTGQTLYVCGGNVMAP